MQATSPLTLLSLALWTACGLAAQHPAAEIKNELISAKLYLPDAQNGYYRGTRFDWSGVVYSLTYGGHEYFGEWHKSDDPYLHDRITGPVEQYRLEDPATDGETYVIIGVGVCRRQPREPDGRGGCEVIDHGKWNVAQGANWIEFTHEANDPRSGYGYRLVKRMTLTPGAPELVIDHTLENTGKNKIEANVYNHNFFVIDGGSTGPGFSVEFPFNLRADRDLKGYAEVQGNRLVYKKEIPEGEHIITLFDGFGPTADDNRFLVENRVSGAGVRMVTDKPLAKLQFWSPHTTLCPEPFIDLKIAPNQADRWAIRYEFYAMPR